LCPKYLGVKAIITKSFARIHKKNLINFGIIPLEFKDIKDYERIDFGDKLKIPEIKSKIEKKEKQCIVENLTKRGKIETFYQLSDREKQILLMGGLLNFIKNKQT
jgi:aconitate hydratase